MSKLIENYFCKQSKWESLKTVFDQMHYKKQLI